MSSRSEARSWEVEEAEKIQFIRKWYFKFLFNNLELVTVVVHHFPSAAEKLLQVLGSYMTLLFQHFQVFIWLVLFKNKLFISDFCKVMLQPLAGTSCRKASENSQAERCQAESGCTCSDRSHALATKTFSLIKGVSRANKLLTPPTFSATACYHFLFITQIIILHMPFCNHSSYHLRYWHTICSHRVSLSCSLKTSALGSPGNQLPWGVWTEHWSPSPFAHHGLGPFLGFF